MLIRLEEVSAGFLKKLGHNKVKLPLLDILAVSEPSELLQWSQRSFISDHDLIFCTLHIEFNTNSELKDSFLYRDFNSIDYRLLYSDALCLDWTVSMKATLTLNFKNLQIRLVLYIIFMFRFVLANHVQKNVLGTLEM